MKIMLYLCTHNSVTNIINSLTSSVMAKLNNITISVSAFRSNEVDAYLNTIRKYKALPYEEEIELATLAKNGNERAKTRLINSNLLFVVSIAKRYQGMGLDILDLISEGNIGLCKAVEEYDTTIGTKFISFAVFYIRQEIINALSEKSRLVRLPLHQIKAKADNSTISFETPIGGEDSEDNKTLLDTFASDSKADTYDHTQAIEHKVKTLLAHLDDRDKEIVCRLFGIGCEEQSEYTLSLRFKVSEERIRQIKWSAIEKMRELI